MPVIPTGVSSPSNSGGPDTSVPLCNRLYKCPCARRPLDAPALSLPTARGGHLSTVPRAIWSGTVSFGLVSIPVRVMSAVHEHALHFHLVHATDNGPIGNRKYCKLDDKAVPEGESVRVFEDDGELVEITDEDLAAVRVKGEHTIELEDFVPYDEIDPTFFAHTYLVAPKKGSERPYALLVRAMEESKLAGIGKFVMRNREYLGCLRVRKGVITLDQMYFADEVDAPEKVIPEDLPSVPKRELDMALDLVKSYSGKWKPDKYEDTYRSALLEMIGTKRSGKKVRPVREPKEKAPADLMEALRASLESRTGSRKSSGRARKKPAVRSTSGRSRSARRAA
jgi:DNA end-binding protein Ku